VQLDCHFNVRVDLLFSHVLVGELLQQVVEVFLDFAAALDLFLADVRGIPFVLLARNRVFIRITEFGDHFVQQLHALQFSDWHYRPQRV